MRAEGAQYKPGRPEKAGDENDHTVVISQRQLAEQLDASQALVYNAFLVLRYCKPAEVNKVMVNDIPFARACEWVDAFSVFMC